MDYRYKRIILATDGVSMESPVDETAFKLAKKHDAEVIIVDTLKPPTLAARWFTSNASDVFEMVLADKQERLKKIAGRFEAGGVKATSKVLFGKSSEAIARDAINDDADLVVRYMKGIRSNFPGLFGNTARELMRTCPCPLLLVGKKTVEAARVLACIDAEHDSHENTAILREARRLVLNRDGLFGLYCWDLYGADMLQRHMNDAAFADALSHAESVYTGVFEKFVAASDLDDFGDRMKIIQGRPAEVIPEQCVNESIEVVVMCSASLNRSLGRLVGSLVGSTIESVIDRLACSLLVVKPDGFVSPLVKAAEVESQVV